MTLLNRLVTNTLSLYTARFMEVIIQLAILAFILSKMGRETYGAALLIISIQETIDLIRSGFGKATIKYLAEYNAKNDYEESQRIFSTSSLINVVIGSAGLLICLIISPFSDLIFSVPREMLAEAKAGTIIMGFGIFLSFIFLSWRHALLSYERYDLNSFARVTARIVNAVAIIIIYYVFRHMLISIILGTAIGNFCEVMLCRQMAHRLGINLRLSYSSFSRASLKIVGRFAFFDMLHPVANIIYKNGSFFLCAHLISLSAVAGLGIIFNICRLLTYLINEVAITLVPVMSRLDSLGQQDKIQEILINSTTVAVCLGGLVLVVMVPHMDSFLLLWLGGSYVYLTNAAILLLFAESLRSSVSYIHHSLSGTGNVRFDGLSDLGGAVLGVSIGVLLVSFFHLGLMGYVMGLCFVNLFRFISITSYGAKIFCINILRFFWMGHFRVYAIVGLFITLCLFIRIQAHSWIILSISGAVPAICYLTVCSYTMTDAATRLRIRSIITERISTVIQKGWA